MVFRKKRLLTLLLLLSLLFTVNLLQSIVFTTNSSLSKKEAEMYTEERDRDVWSDKENQILIREVERVIDVRALEPEGDFEAGPEHQNERLQIKLNEPNGMKETKQSSHVSRDFESQKQRFQLVMGKGNEDREQDPNGRDGQKVREMKFDIVMSNSNESMEDNYGEYQENEEIIRDHEEEEKMNKNDKEEIDKQRNPETENEAETHEVEAASVGEYEANITRSDYITLRNPPGELPTRTTSKTSKNKKRPPEEAALGLLANQSKQETLETLQEGASLPDQGNITRKAPPYNVLLLSSMGRSGSSFLGGLLSSQPGVFYFFEPLHNFETLNLLTKENAVRGLRALFTCNIDGLILQALRRKRWFTIKHNYIKTCKKCFRPHLLNSACRNEPIRVVKTIRTQVDWLLPLLEDSDSNVKVIHLVRDPRASLISTWELEWNITAEYCCSRINQDLRSGRNLNKLFPERYLTVRYEDLCSDPWGMAHIIFSYLGYTNLPSSTISFLKTSITSKSSGRPYSIKRNSYLMQQKWRMNISQKQLNDIEQVCASTIQDIGFSLFHDLNTVRNLSFPLYMKSASSQFSFYNKVV